MIKVLNFDSSNSTFQAIASAFPGAESFWSEELDEVVYLINGSYWVIESRECTKVGSDETGWLLTGECVATLKSIDPPTDLEFQEYCLIDRRIAVAEVA